MGWGDAAAKAFETATEALKAIAVLSTKVEHLSELLSRSENRLQGRFDALEARVRELERENAKLHGAVHSGFAEAMTTVLKGNGPHDSLARPTRGDDGT